MKSPTSLTLLVAVAAATGLVSCSGEAPGNGGDETGPVHLVFRQFDPADQIQGLVEAVGVWNENNPGIQVELETVSPNNPQQLAREANSGSGPDIAQLALADVAFLAEPSILLPLDELMSTNPLEAADELLATDMTILDGVTWAVPWTADTMALVYRADLLGEAGFDTTPETWEEMQEVAGATTESSGGQTSGFCFPAGAPVQSAQWFAINYYMWNHDTQLIELDGETWGPGISVDELAATIDYFNDFFAAGITPVTMQSITDFADPAITTGLNDGTCAMAYMPPAAFRSVQAQVEPELLTAPMPGGLVDGSTHLGGRALGINQNSDHPEEAWEFLKFLMSAETFETYDQYPASAATLTELDVDPTEQGFVDQLPHSVPFVRYIGAPMTIASLQELINQQFSAVYSGQADSETAAQAILDAIDRGLQG